MKNKIKYYRELKGWSQEELAKRSEVSRTTISGLENETINVTTNTTMDKIKCHIKNACKNCRCFRSRHSRTFLYLICQVNRTIITKRGKSKYKR